VVGAATTPPEGANVRSFSVIAERSTAARCSGAPWIRFDHSCQHATVSLKARSAAAPIAGMIPMSRSAYARQRYATSPDPISIRAAAVSR
jgi:hypothetical protein